jgi:hypothetical protein
MQDSMRTYFDEGVPQTLLIEVDRHTRAEDALVEVNQPIHVGRDKRQVMDIVQKLHVCSSGGTSWRPTT